MPSSLRRPGTLAIAALPRATLWRNRMGAAALVFFVGGVYVYTYKRMATTNEMAAVAAELDAQRQKQ